MSLSGLANLSPEKIVQDMIKEILNQMTHEERVANELSDNAILHERLNMARAAVSAVMDEWEPGASGSEE